MQFDTYVVRNLFIKLPIYFSKLKYIGSLMLINLVIY
jgi:hypothetical protein